MIEVPLTGMYDPAADALYVYVAPRAIAGTTEAGDCVNADRDGDGNVTGIEVLRPAGYREKYAVP